MAPYWINNLYKTLFVILLIPALNGESFPASAGMTGANSIRNTTTRFINQFQCLLIKFTCESILEKNFSLYIIDLLF